MHPFRALQLRLQRIQFSIWLGLTLILQLNVVFKSLIKCCGCSMICNTRNSFAMCTRIKFIAKAFLMAHADNCNLWIHIRHLSWCQAVKLSNHRSVWFLSQRQCEWLAQQFSSKLWLDLNIFAEPSWWHCYVKNTTEVLDYKAPHYKTLSVKQTDCE